MLDRLLLTVVLSATIVLLLSMVMLWTDLWSPVLLVHLAALGAAPVLALRGLSRMTGAAAGPRAAPAGVTCEPRSLPTERLAPPPPASARLRCPSTPPSSRSRPCCGWSRYR